MSEDQFSKSEDEIKSPVKRQLSTSDEDEGHSAKYKKVNENTKVVATHYNELEEKGLSERLKSRIFYMRNFNNWIKSIFVNDYLTKIKNNQKLGDPLRVLDMCCGKGGDLLKWEKGGITHLICTDIADISVEQCQSRYNTMINRMNKFGNKFTAEFIACDSTLDRLREKYKDPSMKLNLVSCQFAFHYCFESLSQAECMIRNAAECLLPGGYFIATMPDAYEIMKRQRETGSKSFGNDLYNIQFVCDTDKPPLFGAKYNFHLEGVVDCPEFLVHFPTVVKLARKYGLELVQKDSFANYFKQNAEQGRALLSRMQALEAFPPQRFASLVGKNEDYAHAEKHLGCSLENNSYKTRTIGTLSKPEWEAVTLYLLCAFRKCKNTWDSEGKPIYEWTS